MPHIRPINCQQCTVTWLRSELDANLEYSSSFEIGSACVRQQQQ